MRISPASLVLAFAWVLTRAPEVFACPGCIEATNPGVYRGFLWGMGVMMAMPFLLLAVVGGGLYCARRRQLREEVERFLEQESVASPTPRSQVAGRQS